MTKPKSLSLNKKARVKVRADERILSVAQRLFATYGYEAVKVRDITKQAKANAALISYYYGGKEGLYRSCLERVGQRRLAFAERVLVAPTSASDTRLRLQFFVEEMIESYLAEPFAMLLVHRECERQTDLAEDIFQNIFLRVFEQLKTFLETARVRKFLRADLDCHLAATVFFGMIVHLTRTDALQDKYFKMNLSSPDYRLRVTKTLLDIFFEGSENRNSKLVKPRIRATLSRAAVPAFK